MKIPKELNIGGHLVKIEIEEMDDMSGCWLNESNTIKICKSLSQSQKESTLIHEILHVLNSELDGREIGHMLLDSLANQLYQVLADNKLLK